VRIRLAEHNLEVIIAEGLVELSDPNGQVGCGELVKCVADDLPDRVADVSLQANAAHLRLATALQVADEADVLLKRSIRVVAAFDVVVVDEKRDARVQSCGLVEHERDDDVVEAVAKEAPMQHLVVDAATTLAC
jgi:hypothetical protein